MYHEIFSLYFGIIKYFTTIAPHAHVDITNKLQQNELLLCRIYTTVHRSRECSSE